MATYIRHVRSGLEFDVACQIARRGLVCEVIKQKYLVRIGRGKSRQTAVKKKPALPNILFVEMNAEDHDRLDHIRGLSSTFAILPDVAREDVLRFKTNIRQQNEAVEREYLRSGSATPVFAKGERVVISDGPFSDVLGTFLGMVQEGDQYLCEVDTPTAKMRAPMDKLRTAQ
jgi:transcription antitermination factor NusG